MLREIQIAPRRRYRVLVENGWIVRVDRQVVEGNLWRMGPVYWRPVWAIERRATLGRRLRPVTDAAVAQAVAAGGQLRVATPADRPLLEWVRERERRGQPPPPPKRPRGRPPRAPTKTQEGA